MKSFMKYKQRSMNVFDSIDAEYPLVTLFEIRVLKLT